MIIPENNKKNKNSNQNYKYTFKIDGDITQKPTNKGYDYAIVQKNPELSGLKGVDNYKDYSKNRLFGGYKYNLGNNNTITDFNGIAKNKKSKKRVGTSFTVNDDKVADELYRVVAGNSNVEYGRIRYKQNENGQIGNYIETDKSDDAVYINTTIPGRVVDIIHNHPFGIDNSTGEINSKFPSSTDKEAYKNIKETRSKDNLNPPNHTIYHPVTPDAKKMPYYMPFNEKGAMETKDGEWSNIDKETEDQYELLYQNKYFK